MTVLAPIDGSDASFRALEFAIDLAERFDADLHVIHVTDHQTESTDDLRERANEILADADVDDELEMLTDLGKFRSSSQVGDEIVEYVRERDDVEHVVVGHHRTGKVGRLLLGSAAREIIESEVAPVTVVPSGG